MKYIGIILAVWLAAISLVALFMTIYDKWAAKHNPRHRVPEATLLGCSLLGGSVVMLCTMLTIRHKTKHIKFMLGIPLILILQAAIAIALIYIII
ncbi:MAG: DUF1294 domain-containing protein [Ruminococcaceae bacterium]|nr:DUF1294 domain-containing protein [Oscillospiraceae bacterium]